MKLVFATHNVGKLKEMRSILLGLNTKVVSAEEVGIGDDVVEDGKTFAENALKKARYVAQQSGQWAVADDSGLCIRALNGAPGVFSARWAGENSSDQEKTNFVLEKMKGVPDNKRQAWFESTAAIVSPQGKHWIFTGKIEGQIAKSPRGRPRYKMPYDLIFIPQGEKRTFAEMLDQEKNTISQRGLAFKKLKEFLSNYV